MSRADTVPLLTVKDVARLLNVSVRTIWRWRKAKAVPPPLVIGGAVRWDATALQKWVGQCQEGGET